MFAIQQLYEGSGMVRASPDIILSCPELKFDLNFCSSNGINDKSFSTAIYKLITY